jgi:hypothetical protein
VEDMPDHDAGPRSDLCADANPHYSRHAVKAAKDAAKELHGSLQRPAMWKVRVLEVLQPLGLHGVVVVSAGSGIGVSGAAWQTIPGVTHPQHNAQAPPDSHTVVVAFAVPLQWLSSSAPRTRRSDEMS